MTPDDLIAAVRARLDETERLALAASNYGPGKWAYEDGYFGPKVITEPDHPTGCWDRDINHSVWTCDDPEDGCDEPRAMWRAEGQHMAYHDPAAVLHRVAADRLLLAEYEKARASSHRGEAPAAYVAGLSTAVQLLGLGIDLEETPQ